MCVCHNCYTGVRSKVAGGDVAFGVGRWRRENAAHSPKIKQEGGAVELD